MCQFSRIARACGHFEDENITFGDQCKTVCEASKTNTKALGRAGSCSRCRRKIARQTKQPGGQSNRLTVSAIIDQLRTLQVSAQPAPHGEKLPLKQQPAAPKEKPAPNHPVPKEKQALKPVAPGQKPQAHQVATRPADPRPGQKPAPAPPSSSSGRTGQGATTTGTPSAAARVVSAGTSQPRQGNRSVPPG
ncbi:hypothetical protein NEMBOFW57_001822 [Staphylotrichum longicolle]|uniref:Uncharacterized protein n=1 Tax=Staphylotrichum longicolle TaxID=669026 RepID=A0AAD4F2D0_9PEZI|nr:hypothetical protein NEMBOFW57_001822 [Staphylotrichum longicolle]